MTASSQTPFLQGKKIILAGSGIGGLSFITSLRKQWDPAFTFPEIAIYDRDGRESAPSREGYSLSLHGADVDGGLVALRDLGLLDKIMKLSVLGTDSTQSFRMWSSAWADLMKVQLKPYEDIPAAGIRIRRKDLRATLIEAGEAEDAIVWETTCTSAEKLDSGKIRVHLLGPGGDRSEECDILIAADGASSKMRASFRPDDTLQFAGAIQMGGVARFPDGIPAPVDNNWGMVMTGEGVACFCSPVDDTGVIWGVSRREPQPRPKYNQSEESFQAIMKEAAELGHMIAEPFPSLIKHTAAETAFLFSARDKPPFGHSSSNSGKSKAAAVSHPVTPGVIFIGDANHAVSPFAGNGANLALKDGWDLATALRTHGSLAAALEAYDARALPRAVKTVDTSHDRINFAHYTGARWLAFRAALGFGSWMMWLTGK